MNGARTHKLRLETWKEVAAFFGRTERTVKRWEKERGLPVHRLPGASRSRIYAEVSELEAWLKSPDMAAEVTPEDAPPPPQPIATLVVTPVVAAKSQPQLWLRGLALIAAFAAIALMAGVLKSHFGSNRAAASPEAEAAYLSGLDASDDHGPAALTRALGAFKQAATLSPDYAEAYVGQAHALLLLPDYPAASAHLPAPKAYHEAEVAAHKALKLDPRLGSAHTAFGLARYYGRWDTAGAVRAFARGIKRAPDNAMTRYPYAHYLLLRGQYLEAEDQINIALELNPSSIAIKADRALILAHLGRQTEAMAMLSALTLEDAAFAPPWLYLGDLHYAAGNDRAALANWAQSARLYGDADDLKAFEAGEAALSGGHEAMLHAMLKLYLSLDTEHHAYDIAAIHAALNEGDQAQAFLNKAYARHDPGLIRVNLDPRFAPMAATPAFKTLGARFSGI